MIAEEVYEDILEFAFSSWLREGWRGLKTVVCLEGGVQKKAKKIFLIQNLDFLHTKCSLLHRQRTVDYLVVFRKLYITKTCLLR